MDLLKLVEELRTYRAQVEEAIASMEELARRRDLADRDRKQNQAAGKQRRAKHPRSRLVKQGKHAGKRKSA